jgi:putative lipoic acid-binding regulatory protein
MLMNNQGKEKPDITYPCDWEYRVIADKSSDNLIKAIEYAADNLEYSIQTSNVSKNGNYFSLSVKVNVPSEEKRDEIFKIISDHDDVKMVL